MTCHHLNSVVHPNDPWGHCTCHDCGKHIPLFQVFDNWLTAFRMMSTKSNAELEEFLNGRTDD